MQENLLCATQRIVLKKELVSFKSIPVPDYLRTKVISFSLDEEHQTVGKNL